MHEGSAESKGWREADGLGTRMKGLDLSLCPSMGGSVLGHQGAWSGLEGLAHPGEVKAGQPPTVRQDREPKEGGSEESWGLHGAQTPKSILGRGQ